MSAPAPALSIIVPAYNEAERLPQSLATMRAWLDVHEPSHEVICVDDGSTDATAAIIDELSVVWPQLVPLHHPVNAGKGAAVRTGMLAAHAPLRLFSDADLSTPLADIDSLRSALAAGAAVAIGSRALPGSIIDIHQPRRRELMGRVYNRLLQRLLLPGLHDTQCGFKLFTAAAAVTCFGSLHCQRFGFDAEVLSRARRDGLAIAEVPVRWSHRDGSSVNSLRDSLRMLIDLYRLRRQHRASAHRPPAP